MGDRISIQFKKGENRSAVLFSHWDGLHFKDEAEDYVRLLVMDNLRRSKDKNLIMTMPLDRLEPGTVMISFIPEIVYNGDRIQSNYYLPETVEDGDNSDNGHFMIDIDKIKKKCHGFLQTW